jgi:lipopolysaccharide transport system ATP-binding protein
MAILFREFSSTPLDHFSAEVPDGAIVGLVGDDSPAFTRLLRAAAGLETAAEGTVEAAQPARYLAPNDQLNLAPAATLTIDRTMSLHDAVVRARSRIGLERLRRSGTAILIHSHEQDLLRDMCDEIWWLHEGAIAARGDAREVLAAYNTHVGLRLRDWAASVHQPLEPSMRRGDGRARILSINTLDAAGQPVMTWRSGEQSAIRVSVHFEAAVADPVIGIMIRTRIGFEVYGTNTGLEGIRLGPVNAGENRDITFSFRCELCPQEYTVTAASHDPDGVWHDWVEDAVAFTVTDSRYTAGVANLRAEVSIARG